MTAASCTPSRLGLFSAVAPEKRQQRGYALRQRAFFTPEIRPDSGRCSKASLPCRGLVGCVLARSRAARCCGFPARQFPTPRRFVLELLGD